MSFSWGPADAAAVRCRMLLFDVASCSVSFLRENSNGNFNIAVLYMYSVFQFSDEGQGPKY